MPPTRISRWLTSLVAAIGLSVSIPARADTSLNVEIGWQNCYRQGRWNPIFITASDSHTRNVDMELYAPQDQRFALRIRQGFAITPMATTYAVYAPLVTDLDDTVVTLRDAGTHRLLASYALSDRRHRDPDRQGPPPISVQSDSTFIGISGRSSTAMALQSQLTNPRMTTGYVEQSRLPFSSIGFDALNVLMLDAPNLNKISVDQQDAILDWVRAGGALVMWPSDDPIPLGGPLVSALPCKIAENHVHEIAANVIAGVGLPSRFTKMTGRKLLPASDAITFTLFPKGGPLACRRTLGLGTILVLPADAALFQFKDTPEQIAFWKWALAGTVTLTEDSANNNQRYYNNYYEEDPRRVRAMGAMLDWIADIPGAGQFDFSYITAVLIGMMVVVGPLDWIVLKKLGRQPWTWVTISGWIALITLGAVYAGHRVRSGDLHYRTVQLIDEAEGRRVANREIAGIYSPRTDTYDLNFAPDGWWSVASSNEYYFRSAGITNEITCRQDERCNQPDPMVINVWNMRFLEGQNLNPAPAMIDAELQVKKDKAKNARRIIGTLINHGTVPLENVWIRTSIGIARLEVPPIAPGASVAVSAWINQNDHVLDPPKPSEDDSPRYRPRPTTPTTLPTYETVGNLAPARAARIDQLLKSQTDLACVYAQFSQPPSDIDLQRPDARQVHIGVVRAVVRLLPRLNPPLTHPNKPDALGASEASPPSPTPRL